MVAIAPSQVMRDPSLFARAFLRIQDKRMATTPLNHNRAQAHYLAHRTPRDIILKARQLGFSTAIQGELFRYCTTRPARVTTIGKDDQNTRDLRAMFNRFYDNLPDGFAPERDISNATETRFPRLDSRATIARAGNTSSGRGGTNYAIHLSEIAFYRDASELIKGVTQAGNPKWIVCESTPNGQAGWFYDTVMQAINDPESTSWRVHFYAWWWDDAYRLKLGDDEKITYTDDEALLVESHNLTPEQIKWRRSKVKEIGLSAFTTEYPEDAIACFNAVGGGVFNNVDAYLVAPPADVYEGRFVAGIDWGREDDWTALSIFDADNAHEVFIDRWRHPLSWAQIRQRIADELGRWGVENCWVEKNGIGAVNFEALNDTLGENGVSTRLRPVNMTNRVKANLVDTMRLGFEQDDIRLINMAYATRELKMFSEGTTPSGLAKYSHPDIDGAHDDTVDARMMAYWACHWVRGR